MSTATTPNAGAPIPIVAHEEGGSKGRYVIRLEGLEAEMTYTRAGEKLIIIDHTSVPDALRGRGLGEVLVHHAVADAREGGKAVMPLCPFAKAQFERHPDWADVLKR